MSDFTEAPFSANFSLYGKDALRVQFTVRSNTDPVGHVALVGEYLVAAQAAGYAVTLPGLEPGEETEEVDAWVLGETSKGEPCVYLYSSHHGLRWKKATVYVEDLDQLPFKVSGAKTWPGGAPEREVATKKGYLHEAEPFKIVLEPSGRTSDDGKEYMRFARVHDAAPVTQQGPPPSGDDTDWRAQQERENLRPKKNGNKVIPVDNEIENRVVNSADPKVFFQAVVDLCPRYDHINAAKAVLKNLGYTALSKTPEGRLDQLRHVQRYAANRDAGMDEDNAMAAAIPDAKETEAA